MGQRRCRRGLLGRAATAATTFGTQAARVDAALDVEHARMVGTARRYQIVRRQWLTARLQPFLQACLRILVVRCRRGSKPWRDEGAHKFAAGNPAAVEMNRSDERFERVGQDRIATESSALQLAGPQVQRITEVEIARDRGEGRLADQARTQARQLAFVRLGEFLEKKFGNDHVDQRVAEELQPLVVARTSAAVSQRAFAQPRVVEAVGDTKQSVPRVRLAQVFRMLEMQE